MTTYLWDFGDGATSTEKNPTHAYAAPGEYAVTLTARVGIYGPQTVSVRTITVISDDFTWEFRGTQAEMQFWDDYAAFFHLTPIEEGGFFNAEQLPNDTSLNDALNKALMSTQGSQGVITTASMHSGSGLFVSEYVLNQPIAADELAFVGVWGQYEGPDYDPNNPQVGDAVQLYSNGLLDLMQIFETFTQGDVLGVAFGGVGRIVTFFKNGQYVTEADPGVYTVYSYCGFVPEVGEAYLQVRPNPNDNGDMQYFQAYLDLIVAQGGSSLGGTVAYWISDAPQFSAPGATYTWNANSNNSWRNVKLNTTNKTQFTSQGSGAGADCCVVEFKLGPNYFVEDSDPLYLGIQTISGSPNSGTSMVSQSGDQTMMYITSQGEFKIYGNETFGPINTSVTFGAGDVIGIVWSIDLEEGQNVNLFKNGIQYATLTGMTIPIGSRSFSFCAGRVVLA